MTEDWKEKDCLDFGKVLTRISGEKKRGKDGKGSKERGMGYKYTSPLFLQMKGSLVVSIKRFGEKENHRRRE